MKFTHLHVHSHYSLLDGLSKINNLLSAAKELGMDSIALTDHGSLYGAVEFYQKAKKLNIKPIIGSELYLAPQTRFDRQPGIDERYYHLLVLVKNKTGYQNLVQLITKANLEGFYYKPRIDKELLKKHSAGLICLSGCLSGEIPRAIVSKNFEKAENLIKEYLEIFGDDFYFELQHHANIPTQDLVNQKLKEFSVKYKIPLVATNDSHYLKKDDAPAHEILLAVNTGGFRLSEPDRFSMKDADFSLLSPEEMTELFKDTPEAIENTQKISEKCDFNFELGEYQLPSYELPANYTSDSYLKKLCENSLKTKFPPQSGADNKVFERLNYELELIQKTGFASYFLIVQDIVNWAKQKGIFVGPGRGSVVGSLVSYLLNITSVDPLKYNLLFERFLTADRVTMPDADLDFDDKRRNEVLDYVTNKYGNNRVAQIITFGTMAARAAIRDVGRALNMPYSFCDQIAKLIPFGWTIDKALQIKELDNLYQQNEQAKKIIDFAKKLEGVNRHASTHACGIIIGKDELTDSIPLQYASQSDKIIITQYGMHAIEVLGFLKMDFLGLRNLTIIKNSLKLIEKNHNKKINIDKIPLDDKKTFQMLREGKTTGVFQLEGSGMTRYLVELKPTELEDIIAMIALYRPGPIELIPEYIARKHGKKKITYLHPKLEPILKNTYGIMIYQEQLMEMARIIAGFTLSEADTLRKAIGKKIKNLLQEQKEKFLSGAKKQGINEEITLELWKLIEPFDRYGFNRSHAVSYALISYQTAYLKANYPTEFMTALMIAEGSDIEKGAILIQKCQELGIEVLPPDINESLENFTNIGPSKIRFGLTAIKNVGENVVLAIIKARHEKGKFSSLTDFIEKIQHKDLNKKSLEALIKSGAMEKFGERNQLIQNLDLILNYSREIEKNQRANQITFFSELPQQIKLNAAPSAPKKDRLAWEKEILGLYISDHPLNDLKEKLEKQTLAIHKINKNFIGKKIKIGGIISNIQKVTTKDGKPMLFLNLEDLTSRMEIVIFPSLLESNQVLLEKDRPIMVSGRINERDGAIKLLGDEIEELV